MHLCCDLANCSAVLVPSSGSGASLGSLSAGDDSVVLSTRRDSVTGAPVLDWPAPDLPLCDRCGHDCSATLVVTPAEHATCPLCGFSPLSEFYSEVDARDHGGGGRCLMCGCVQTPLHTQCLSCGGVVLDTHTEYYGAFGGYRSRELLVAIGRSLGALVPPSVFHDLLLHGGLDSWEARPIVSSYVRHCRGRFGFARGCSLAYLVAVGYSLGFPSDVVAVIMGHGGLDAACARAVATLVDYRRVRVDRRERARVLGVGVGAHYPPAEAAMATDGVAGSDAP